MWCSKANDATTRTHHILDEAFLAVEVIFFPTGLRIGPRDQMYFAGMKVCRIFGFFHSVCKNLRFDGRNGIVGKTTHLHFIKRMVLRKVRVLELPQRFAPIVIVDSEQEPGRALQYCTELDHNIPGIDEQH